MGDYINQRYRGMGTYDLQRYYDLLLIMRKYYRADNSKDSGTAFLLGSITLVFIIALLGWSIWKNEWMVTLLSTGLAISLFSKSLFKHTHDSAFEAGFVSKVMEAGFSRADATEFLYDIDWDDIQYEESRVEDILKDLEKLKNAKN